MENKNKMPQSQACKLEVKYLILLLPIVKVREIELTQPMPCFIESTKTNKTRTTSMLSHEKLKPKEEISTDRLTEAYEEKGASN